MKKPTPRKPHQRKTAQPNNVRVVDAETLAEVTGGYLGSSPTAEQG